MLWDVIYLPCGGSLVLLTELLLQLGEALRHFVDGLEEISILVVLRVEILLVAAALLTADDAAVLLRVLVTAQSRLRIVALHFHILRQTVGTARIWSVWSVRRRRHSRP